MEEKIDGRVENYIPTSRRVTVSMTLGDYEAEKRRQFEQGEAYGGKCAKRGLIFVLTGILNRTYSPEVVTQDSLTDEEFTLYKTICEKLYGPEI